MQLRSLYKVEPTNQRSTTINLLIKTNHSPEERKSLLDNAAVGEEPRYPGHLEDGLPNRAQSRLQVSANFLFLEAIAKHCWKRPTHLQYRKLQKKSWMEVFTSFVLKQNCRESNHLKAKVKLLSLKKAT